MFAQSTLIRTRAFTLIELLVATGITALIAGLVVLILGNVLQTWARTVGKAGAERQARAVLDQLALDLQAATFRDDGAVWMAVTILDDSINSGLWASAVRQTPAGPANHSLAPMTADFAEARFGQAGIWLRFFTSGQGSNDPENTAATTSAPVAVAYQIIRHRASPNPSLRAARYLLYRSQARPMESSDRPGAFESGYDLDPRRSESNYTRLSPGLNDGTQLGDPVSIFHPDHTGNILEENVIDFGVRFMTRDPGGAWNTLFPQNQNQVEYLGRWPLPDAVDILVRILTEQGAQQLALLEAEPNRLGPRPALYRNDAEWWWGIAEAHSQVFVRRIALRGGRR